MKSFDKLLVIKRIKELRVAKGFSQQELGKKIGFAQNTIAQYESGIITPNLETIFKLAIIFDTTSDYILGLTDIY